MMHGQQNIKNESYYSRTFLDKNEKKSKHATTRSDDVYGTVERTSVLDELHLWNRHFAKLYIFDDGVARVISTTLTRAFPLSLEFTTNTTSRETTRIHLRTEAGSSRNLVFKY
jgi:hypothetical protein